MAVWKEVESSARVEKESFDVFLLDLLQEERQILRYSRDEKLLLHGIFYGFYCNICGILYGELDLLSLVAR